MPNVLPRVPQRWHRWINNQLPLADGLVYAFPLNEGSGQSIFNYAGGHNIREQASTGEIQWAYTTIGRALTPSNTASFILSLGLEAGQAGNQYLSNTTTPNHSWSIWAYLKSGTTQAYLLDYSTLATTDACQLVYNSSNGLSFSTDGSTFTVIPNFTTNTWHHLCLIERNGNWTFFIDNIAQATGSFPSGNGALACGQVYLANRGVTGNAWNGYVSNFNFWQRALSNGEVKDLYNHPFRLYEPPKDAGIILRLNRFSYTAGGKALLSGTANVKRVASPTTSGKVLLSASAPHGKFFSNTASGQVNLSGSAPHGKYFPNVASGKALLSGVNTYKFKAQPNIGGNVTISGTAIILAPETFISTGQLLKISGNAKHYGTQNVSATGKVLISGKALVWSPITLSGSGQVKISGVVFPNVNPFLFGSGSLNIGGSAVLTRIANPTASGTVLIMKTAYPKGFALRLDLTVPAGKVTENILGLVMKRTVYLDPTLVPRQRFALTDASGTYLPYKTLNYDLGRLTFLAKVNLQSSVDNIFFLYFA